jgi:hypothetical protein
MSVRLLFRHMHVTHIGDMGFVHNRLIQSV